MYSDDKIRVYLYGLSQELDEAALAFTNKLKNKLHLYQDEMDILCGVAANLMSLSSMWKEDDFINDEDFMDYVHAVKARKALTDLNLEGVDI